MRSQNARILDWLQSGHGLTAAQALRLFGCFRLAARIAELRRAGHAIDSEMVEAKRSDGSAVRVARYSLRGDA